MVNIVAQLSQKGLISVIKNPLDKREHFVYLTPKAEKIIPELSNIIGNTILLLQEGVPHKNLINCFEVLRIINNNLLSVVREKPAIKCG